MRRLGNATICDKRSGAQYGTYSTAITSWSQCGVLGEGLIRPLNISACTHPSIQDNLLRIAVRSIHASFPKKSQFVGSELTAGEISPRPLFDSIRRKGRGRDSQQNYFVYIFAFLMLPTQINNPKTSYVLMTRWSMPRTFRQRCCFSQKWVTNDLRWIRPSLMSRSGNTQGCFKTPPSNLHSARISLAICCLCKSIKTDEPRPQSGSHRSLHEGSV